LDVALPARMRKLLSLTVVESRVRLERREADFTYVNIAAALAGEKSSRRRVTMLCRQAGRQGAEVGA
jgi:hypothetical protein